MHVHQALVIQDTPSPVVLIRTGAAGGDTMQAFVEDLIKKSKLAQGLALRFKDDLTAPGFQTMCGTTETVTNDARSIASKTRDHKMCVQLTLAGCC